MEMDRKVQEAKLALDRDERNLVYQYAPSGDIRRDLREILPYIREPLAKRLVEGTLQKLENLSTEECQRLGSLVFKEMVINNFSQNTSKACFPRKRIEYNKEGKGVQLHGCSKERNTKKI